MRAGLLVVVLVGLLSAAPSGAADYYVKNGGANAADGLSVATAWATLAHAAGVVAPDDTVHVLDGNYQGFDLRRSGHRGQPDRVSRCRSERAHHRGARPRCDGDALQ